MWALVLKVALVVVLIAEIAVVVILSQRDETPAASPAISAPSPEPSDDFDVTGAEYVSRRGGYSFEYPRAWKVTDRRTVTRLASPSGNAVLSAGLGPPGGVRHAAQALVRLLTTTYEDVSVDGIVGDTVAGLPALRVEATGTNEEGTRFRFLGVAIKGPDRIFTVATFARGQSRRGLAAQIDAVLDSFEITQSAESA